MPTQSPAAADASSRPRFNDDPFEHLDPTVAGALIAYVLRRAHETALNSSPDEARAILHVARSFADELAMKNPEFDRLGFIKASTG